MAVQQRNRRTRTTAEPGTLKRTGLHRLDCEQQCGAYVYATVAQLEQHGMPFCSCGARFIPDRPELALHVLPADDTYRLDVEAALTTAISRSARGQMRSTGAGHAIRSMGREQAAPELLAAARLEEQRAADARRRRLSGLRRGQLQPSLQVDVIPF